MMKPADARKPNDIALERDVIAACLLRPETIGTVGLSEEDFAYEPHRHVWTTMLHLHETGEQINLVSVRTRLVDTDKLAQAGGEVFLSTLRQPAAARALPIDRLHKLTKRRAVRAAAEAVAAAMESNDPDLASAAMEGMRTVEPEDVRRKPKSARRLAEEWYAALNRDPNEGTVSPGLDALKRSIGRLDEGSVTLVGADVNVGKSTVALEMIFGAILDGESGGYLSMEDPEKVVTERVMGRLGGMSAKRIRRFRPGDGGDVSIERAMKAMHAVDEKLQVSNCIGMNEREVLDQLTMMAKSGCRLIVLDYIGVVGCSVKQQDRRNEIRWIATRCKARAAFAKVALVIVSQFQRPKEGDTSRKPNKHSFRESGDLEAMAEYAVVMWRKVEDDFAPIYFELAKSKTGGVGYGWTMQRELKTRDGFLGSGHLIEVRHGDERVFDEDGREMDVRLVMEDPKHMDRWDVGKSAR